jgi:glyoxylase-like metal-dependent hydrolase (beta-lactamase superfamily II)
VPRLLQRVAAKQVDVVFISHGHPDHCADLNPLLRARVLRCLAFAATGVRWTRWLPWTAGMHPLAALRLSGPALGRPGRSVQ